MQGSVQVLRDFALQNWPLLDRGKIRGHFAEKSENAL